MNATASTEESPRPVRPLTKVLLVWTLLSVIFFAFSVVYWPSYKQRALTLPESFMDYAATLSPEEARTVLIEGVERFNPPCEETFSQLAALEAQRGDNKEAAWLSARANFYGSIQTDPASAESLVALTQNCTPWYPEFSLPQNIQTGLSTAVASFAKAIGIDGELSQLLSHQQVALLALGGSLFSFDGQIGKTGVQAPLNLLAYSGGGMDERRDAHIFTSNTDHATRQRGMHIVLLHAKTGAIIQIDLFDIWEDTFEARRMLGVLNSAPDGCIGLFAACDDASAFMTSDIGAGLMQFGIGRRTFAGREQRILSLRCSFAAIGVKGAPPDSAMQCLSPEWFNGRRGHPVVCAVFTPGEPS